MQLLPKPRLRPTTRCKDALCGTLGFTSCCSRIRPTIRLLLFQLDPVYSMVIRLFPLLISPKLDGMQERIEMWTDEGQTDPQRAQLPTHNQPFAL